MKSKFARCAKQDDDRRNATSFTDKKRIGDVFSQKTANMVMTSCHNTPQMHDMRGMSDDMHGAEMYVTHAKKPFMNCSKPRKKEREDDLMLFTLGMIEVLGASQWGQGNGAASFNYSAPQYH